MLAEPARTPYDLNLRLLGFRVRIHPLFWLGAALLGGSYLELGLHFLAIWILVVLASIVVHELGHAVALRAFGSDSHIVLYIFGGLAVPYGAVVARWRRIVVALAGPVAGFLLCAAVYGSHELTDWGSMKNGAPVWFLCHALIFVNLYWGILNLLPVFPLDGGQVTRELCSGRSPVRGLRMSLKISVAVAGAVAVYSLICAMDESSRNGWLNGLPWWFPRGSLWTAILFALLAVQSYQLLQTVGRVMYYETPDDRVSWER